MATEPRNYEIIGPNGDSTGGGGGGGSGTVTSVGLTLPSLFTVSGSPVTTSGTLMGALANQAANTVFAGPASGAAATPTFRALTLADLPAGFAYPAPFMNYSGTTAVTATAAENGAVFEQNGTTGTLNVTLANGTASNNLDFNVANFGSGASMAEATPAAGAGLYVLAMSTPLTGTQVLRTSDPFAFATFTQSPNSSAYVTTSMSGKWVAYDGTTVLATLINNWVTDADTTNLITAVASASTVVARNPSGVSSFKGVTLAGSSSGSLTVAPAASTTSYSVTMPAAQAPGALTNDGSGNLTWTPSSGGSSVPTIVPSTGTVTVTEAESGDYFVAQTGGATWNLPVLASGNVAYTFTNSAGSDTSKLAIPSGMTLQIPDQTAVAGPTTFTCTKPFATVRILGNLSAATYTVLEETSSWSNP